MPKSPKSSSKVMYPCIFLAFYMSVRKLQGFITFHFLAFLEVFLKCYISLYFSYTHIEGKENTRICNFWWNVTYPCIFLALYMCVRKIQGYVTFHGKKVEKLHILVFSLHIGRSVWFQIWKFFNLDSCFYHMTIDSWLFLGYHMSQKFRFVLIIRHTISF